MAHGKKPRWTALYDRHMPADTDPCSRHVKIISEELRSKRSSVRAAMIGAGMDPDHMAESMEMTVISLWKAREKMRRIT